MTLKVIRLELIDTVEPRPGLERQGYIFQAPLTEDGCLDADGYDLMSSLCRVRKFIGRRLREGGQLVRAGQGWGFCCPPEHEDQNEATVCLGAQIFRVGDEIKVTDDQGETRRFRVTSIGEVPIYQVRRRA